MTPLGREIAALIEREGPIPLDRYMSLCLGHPTLGYYATRDPFGAQGDFVTAPEISQMFGELIGLWCAEVWRMMGAPARVALVELGPGRGTLMADMLRAAKAAPGFLAAIEVVLVETSPALREVQAERLASGGVPVRWAASVEEALDAGRDPSPGTGEGEGGGGVGLRAGRAVDPSGDVEPGSATIGLAPGDPTRPRLRLGHPPLFEGGIAPHAETDPGSAASAAVRDDAPLLPALVVANEFFDALPIRQFVRTTRGWRERLVGLGSDGALAFGLAPALPEIPLPDAPVGSVREICPQGLATASRIARHLAAHGGACLAIDYGYAAGAGDTLQAMRAHAFAEPLQDPGEADLTAHVDFGALAAAAARGGAAPMRLLPQADLLERLGLAARAERLSRQATPQQAEAIAAAVRRLTDRSPRGMGALFKALAFGDARLGPLPGFAPAGP